MIESIIKLSRALLRHHKDDSTDGKRKREAYVLDFTVIPVALLTDGE